MFIQLTQEEIEDKLYNEGNVGYCLHCGEEAYGVEPDACKYTCEACDMNQVYGLEELLIMGKVKLI